jgi:O-antigen/teichoic acid export membrane protein
MAIPGQNDRVSESDAEDKSSPQFHPPFEGLESGAPSDGALNENVEKTGLLKGKISSIKREWDVPLYRNAYLMMINTATTSVLGFLYWFIAGNVYSEEEVGRNTALISAMALLSNIAQLNGAQILMRYLPAAGLSGRRLVNLTIGIPALASALLTMGVLMVTQLITADDYVLHVGVPLGLWFIVSVVAWSMFNLQDATFIGLRRVMWVPISNTSFGAIKVLLLFPFVGLFAGYGIFVAWTLPVLFSLIPLQVLLYKKYIPIFESEATGEEPPIDKRAVVRYVAWDYFGWMFSQAAGTIVPLLIVSTLSEKENAYFYMASIIATAVDLFVINLMTSLVVEASRDLGAIAHLSRLIVKRIMFLVVPAVVFIIVAAPLFFLVLPGNYGDQGTSVLRLLALATLPRVVIALSNSLSRLDQKTHQVTILQAVHATLIISLSVTLMPHMGINGAGVAILASASIVAIAVMPRLVRRLSPRFAQPAVPSADAD